MVTWLRLEMSITSPLCRVTVTLGDAHAWHVGVHSQDLVHAFSIDGEVAALAPLPAWQRIGPLRCPGRL
jgi:hypothetical protein